MRFFVNLYTNNVASAALTSGAWYHVAATYDGAAMRLYVNGAQANSKTYSTAVTHASRPFNMGEDGWTREYTGYLDEVRVSSVARTAGWTTGEQVVYQYDSLARLVNATTGSTGPLSGRTHALQFRPDTWFTEKG